MLGSIKYNLAHLLDFRGRDARQTFWYYVLFLFVLNMAIGLVVVIPFIGQVLVSTMAAAQSGDPAAMETAMAAPMGEMMESMLGLGLFTTALNAVLLAAAFTRRLHDSNLPGWWALVPLGLQLAASYYSYTRIEQLKALTAQMMSQTDPQAALMAQSQISAQGLIGWLAIIALVVLGVRKSTEGPNRYAEAPVRF
jgi:uncharacterized membrane protein YhaH (DUF805 family)